MGKKLTYRYVHVFVDQSIPERKESGNIVAHIVLEPDKLPFQQLHYAQRSAHTFRHRSKVEYGACSHLDGIRDHLAVTVGLQVGYFVAAHHRQDRSRDGFTLYCVQYRGIYS